MRWCIRKNVPECHGRCRRLQQLEDKSQSGAETKKDHRLIDGVITDDPKLFRDVCERFEDELDGKVAAAPVGLLAASKRRLLETGDMLLAQLLGNLIFVHVMYKGRLDFLKASDRR